MASTMESATAGITRGIAPYAILAGILVVVYLKRDAIAAWIQKTITSPLSDLGGSVTKPFVDTGHALGQWFYESTNPVYKEAMADQAYFDSLLASSSGPSLADQIVASKSPSQWATGPFGLSMTIVGQNSNMDPAIVATGQTDPAITYTSEEMSNMSKGKTTDPGTGYVVRGQSLTGADLFRVGPWTKVGKVTIHDPSGDFMQDIWKNPIGGEMTVGDRSSGIAWVNFQRIEKQYGRKYEVDWL